MINNILRISIGLTSGIIIGLLIYRMLSGKFFTPNLNNKNQHVKSGGTKNSLTKA